MKTSQGLMMIIALASLSAHAEGQGEVQLGNLETKECTNIRSKDAPRLVNEISVDGFNIRNCDNCEPLALPTHLTAGFKKLQQMGLKDNEMSAIYDYTNSCIIVFQIRGSDVEIRSSYGASGGRGGVGNEIKSGRTPRGVHKTSLGGSEAKRIAKAPLNANLDPGYAGYSNPIVIPTLEQYDWPTDFVLSRFVRLLGLEPALNSNSVNRKILFHGTHEEGLLGYDESGGCIRLANKDVVRLFDELPLGSLINIVAAPGQKASRFGNDKTKGKMWHYEETLQLGPKKSKN